jgi:light-regulated signal transduction histidine kinase (bacteriophytochrome)
MGDSGPDRSPEEIERLRQALDREMRRCLDLRRQLDGASAEFEQFVSMAAHNVREPLRDVASYTQLLAEAYAGRLDSEASAFLTRIQEGAASMQALLADVVNYWATGTGDGQPSRTDMEAVLRQALLLADKQITEQNAIVTHDPLPAVTGDFEMLAKVLHHLIRNAIEYCGTPSPRVHVSSRQVDLEWVISVKDNGPGIDPAFQGRLFGVFKRLHGKEYPGNGLGLAFCKKAIESQGGRVWIESSSGAGSTFYFTVAPAD